MYNFEGQVRFRNTDKQVRCWKKSGNRYLETNGTIYFDWKGNLDVDKVYENGVLIFSRQGFSQIPILSDLPGLSDLAALFREKYPDLEYLRHQGDYSDYLIAISGAQTQKP